MKHQPLHKNQTFGPVDFAVNSLHLALRAISLPMSYETRIHMARSVADKVLGLSRGQTARIAENLDLIFPHMSETWKTETIRDCRQNIGQSVMEHMHMTEFAERIGHLNISGAGVEAIDRDRGAILVSGHFGQWEGIRVAWKHLTGRDCGFFFRPNNNGYYDLHWRKYLRQAGEPIIPKSAAGKAQMARHLANNGALLMVIDQRIQKAERIDFMGHPAKTATTAAQLALTHDLPLIPAYAIRRPSLIDYDIVFEEPVAPSNPLDMTKALNASLGERVFSNPEQYFWSHRRWR